MSLAQAVEFYLRVLSFTWIIPISFGLNPWRSASIRGSRPTGR
jgi:hypothetical protein